MRIGWMAGYRSNLALISSGRLESTLMHVNQKRPAYQHRDYVRVPTALARASYCNKDLPWSGPLQLEVPGPYQHKDADYAQDKMVAYVSYLILLSIFRFTYR
jgi:hypothetical protein